MRHPYSEALFRFDPARSTTTARRRCTRSRASRPTSPRGLDGCRFAPRCRYVTERCRAEEPLLGPDPADAASEHVFACFHPVDVSARDDVPVEPIRLVEHVNGSVNGAAPAEREVLLQIDHLVKEFPVTAGVVIQRNLGTVKAVSDVSFSVRRGETFGLVGESGCGKTTIGWLIVALHKATTGSILLRGRGSDVARHGRPCNIGAAICS